MKRLVVVTLFGLLLSPLSAQLQLELQYDFRHLTAKDNPVVTPEIMVLTTSYLGFDKCGSTYFFSDFSFNGSQYGLGGLYYEISRELQFWKIPISIHLEYNGGFQFASSKTEAVGITFSNTPMIGVGSSHIFQTNNRYIDQLALSGYLAYRCNILKDHNFGGDNWGKLTSHDAQFTVVWDFRFFKERLQITGFADLYSDDLMVGSGKVFKLYTEPQFWYFPVRKFAIGGEIKMGYNFFERPEADSPSFYAFPSLGIKWVLTK